MKLKTVNKILAILIFVIGISYSVYSQNLFVENFSYPVRDSLEEIGGWYRSGGNSSYNVRIKSPGLTYSGYLGSGIGNYVYFSNETNGDFVLNSFSPVDSASVYMSFLIRVDSLSANATEGYNIGFNPGESTNFNTLTCIRKLTSSTFNFGIKKLDYSPAYSNTVYFTNVTYLVVVKYTFVNGNNDSAKIYVFNSGVPSSEPSSPTAFQIAGNDVLDIATVVLTNSYVQSGLQKSSVKVDGIRVGKTWASTLMTNVYRKLYLKALIQGFYNNVSDKMVKDTARVYLRYSFPPYALVDSSKTILDSAGNGKFLFNSIGNLTNCYAVFKHRNSLETWSSSSVFFYSDSLNYDFTSSIYKAYGNNLILKGLKYCIYNGDVNQDRTVDVSDMVYVYNDMTALSSGYLKTDVNGDGFVDVADLIITYNNAINVVTVVEP